MKLASLDSAYIMIVMANNKNRKKCIALFLLVKYFFLCQTLNYVLYVCVYTHTHSLNTHLPYVKKALPLESEMVLISICYLLLICS